jgi:2-keto-4-pentenoate hydratase
MGQSLQPRPKPYTQREVLDAVDGLFLGVEVPDSRFEDFTAVGAAQLIADDACADRFVLGPEVKVDWRSKDLADHVVKGRKADQSSQPVVGNGAAVLGDPRRALTWMANELSEHGVELGKGQFVTTGTCIVPLPVQPGDVVTGDYGPDFGTIQVRFVD